MMSRILCVLLVVYGAAYTKQTQAIGPETIVCSVIGLVACCAGVSGCLACCLRERANPVRVHGVLPYMEDPESEAGPARAPNFVPAGPTNSGVLMQAHQHYPQRELGQHFSQPTQPVRFALPGQSSDCIADCVVPENVRYETRSYPLL